jgi:hypothetical protein
MVLADDVRVIVKHAYSADRQRASTTVQQDYGRYGDGE